MNDIPSFIANEKQKRQSRWEAVECLDKEIGQGSSVPCIRSYNRRKLQLCDR
jgi:hypothetical protein